MLKNEMHEVLLFDFSRLKPNALPVSPAPLYIRLQQAITAQISDGTLAPGEKLASERELQEALGYSRATLRHALRALQASGLVRSVPGSGTFVLDRQLESSSLAASLSRHEIPQAAPASLASPLTVPGAAGQVVGMIVGFPSFHLYYSQLAAVFAHTINQAGWTLEMALSNDSLAGMQQALNSMLMRGIRVFAINPLPAQDMSAILDDLLNHGALVQLVGRSVNYANCDTISVDNERIGYQATRHLIELSHTQIIYKGLWSHTTGRQRAAGYVRAMQENNLQPRIFQTDTQPAFPLSSGLASYLEPIQTSEELIREISRGSITAAFCFNDNEAAWLSKRLHQAQIKVPRDISLVGVDHMQYLAYESVPLTTFDLPGAEIGRQAAELLLRRIAGEKFPLQKISLPAALLQRDSTAPPRGNP